MEQDQRTRSPFRFGRWTLSLIGVVVAVNAVSVVEIAVALRGLREDRERTLQLETEARAGALASALSMTSAELIFLVGSAPIGYDPAIVGPRWREDVGAALLLFLHGHPQVQHLVLRDAAGSAILEAGRPRGVPGYWIPGAQAPARKPEGSPYRGFEVARVSQTAAKPLRLEASLELAALLAAQHSLEAGSRVDCTLRDADGRLLAGEAGGGGADPQAAEAAVSAAGWNAPEPWRLRCVPPAVVASGAIEPLVARHRTLIVLNLFVMVFAAILGLLAYHQSRRRQQSDMEVREQTRIRELERRLFHSERLSTVGRLAAGMAHEINNPLEGMANYLRLADDSLDRGDLGSGRRHIEGVRQGLERAAGIVRRVLSHANPSAALHEDVDVADVVTRSVDFVCSRDEFSKIRFGVDLPPHGAMARGSAVMLGQVFLNLLLNACEAQPEGGEVYVRCTLDGRHVDAEVSDRGPGVPASRKTQIFEPFETTKQSSGLGLSICHSIVQQHGGELTVHDREGGGSVFRVRLRAAERERSVDATG